MLNSRQRCEDPKFSMKLTLPRKVRNVRYWPIATEIHVPSNVGDQGKSGLVVLNVSFVARDPKPTSHKRRWPRIPSWHTDLSGGTPIHELERYMRKDCSEVRGYPYMRSRLCRASVYKDFGKRSAIDMVAGRAMNCFAATPQQWTLAGALRLSDRHDEGRSSTRPPLAGIWW